VTFGRGRRRVVVAAHGGEEGVVSAFRMLRIEVSYCRLRPILERGIECPPPERCCQRHYIGDVCTPKSVIGRDRNRQQEEAKRCGQRAKYVRALH
jgi:hypothetical protein